MKAFSSTCGAEGRWLHPQDQESRDAQLVLAFGSREKLGNNDIFGELARHYPLAQIVACSTAGEIHPDGEIHDDTVVANALCFGTTTIQTHQLRVSEFSNASELGGAIVSALPKEGLRHILVFSDGQQVNGDALVRGVNQLLPEGVSVTGGLAGDGSQFIEANVGLNSIAEPGNVVAVGWYGDDVRVGYGSRGGWDTFGPVRHVTRSEENVLFELDSSPALDLYKSYLGDQADKLPESALLFPLAILRDDGGVIVRTVLSIDHEANSLTFAGELPVGCRVQFMRANFDHLIDGAGEAAQQSHGLSDSSDYALLISCVGRRLILGPRTAEEIEEVKHSLKAGLVGGYYSYGEICQAESYSGGLLHNQTMTVTTFSEG